MNNGQMIASDDVFYAGIFPVDAQGNAGATPVDIVKLNNNASVTVEVAAGRHGRHAAGELRGCVRPTSRAFR